MRAYGSEGYRNCPGGQPWDMINKLGPWKTSQRDSRFIQEAGGSVRGMEGYPSGLASLKGQTLKKQ